MAKERKYYVDPDEAYIAERLDVEEGGLREAIEEVELRQRGIERTRAETFERIADLAEGTYENLGKALELAGGKAAVFDASLVAEARDRVGGNGDQSRLDMVDAIAGLMLSAGEDTPITVQYSGKGTFQNDGGGENFLLRFEVLGGNIAARRTVEFRGKHYQNQKYLGPYDIEVGIFPDMSLNTEARKSFRERVKPVMKQFEAMPVSSRLAIAGGFVEAAHRAVEVRAMV